MTAPTGEPLVFPLGHAMGPFHPHRGAPPAYWVVRLGWDSPLLQDQPTADVWALAHGRRDRIDRAPWTRSELCRAARAAGIDEPEPVLDALIGRGLVAEVSPGTAEAAQFADTHRVQSLLLGLGELPDEPGVDGIGLLGMPPVARVPLGTYEFWQWGHLWPTLTRHRSTRRRRPTPSRCSTGSWETCTSCCRWGRSTWTGRWPSPPPSAERGRGTPPGFA
jgi:hypothetical protein